MHTNAGKSIYFAMFETWSDLTLQRLRANQLSMPAGEALAMVAFADELLQAIPEAEYMSIFSDSMAVKELINTNYSPSPQLNVIGRWLFSRHPAVQFHCWHCRGCDNIMADKLSRNKHIEVLSVVRNKGYIICRLSPGDDFNKLIDEAVHAQQRAPRVIPSQAKRH